MPSDQEKEGEHVYAPEVAQGIEQPFARMYSIASEGLSILIGQSQPPVTASPALNDTDKISKKIVGEVKKQVKQPEDGVGNMADFLS